MVSIKRLLPFKLFAWNCIACFCTIHASVLSTQVPSPLLCFHLVDMIFTYTCIFRVLSGRLTENLLTAMTLFFRITDGRCQACMIWSRIFLCAHFPSPGRQPVAGHSLCIDTDYRIAGGKWQSHATVCCVCIRVRLQIFDRQNCKEFALRMGTFHFHFCKYDEDEADRWKQCSSRHCSLRTCSSFSSFKHTATCAKVLGRLICKWALVAHFTLYDPFSQALKGR